MKKIIQYPKNGYSRIAVVGEAPGKDEVTLKIPFIGYEGKAILRPALKGAGLDPYDCYITNTVHTKPPRNIYKALGHQAIQEGIDELRKDLMEWKENGLTTVIAVGNNALVPLTGKSGITKYRGYVLPCTLVPGLKVVPTIHPGFIVRGNDHYLPILKLDVEKAITESTKEHIHYPDRNIQIIRNPGEAVSLLKSMHDCNFIVVDIETAGPVLTAYGIATSRDTAYSITKDALQNPRVMKEISLLAYDKNVTKCFHNCLYDCLHNLYYHKIVNRNIADTMIAQHAVYPIFPKSLSFCASIYTNEPYWKDEGKNVMDDIKKGKPIDWDTLYIYNGKDCCLTYEIWEILQEEMDSWGVKDVYDFDMELVEPCLYAMIRGIKYDHISAKEEYDKLHIGAENLLRIINGTIGNINPNSPKQVGELLYDIWGLPEQKKDGKRTTEAKKLRKLAILPTPYSKYIKLMLKYKELKKRAEFLDIPHNEDGRVRTALNICGTYTGRFSSSKSIFDSGRNLQNTPKITRKAFKSDDGKIFIQADLSQSEARIVAACSKNVEWLKEFDTIDQHKKVASLIFDIPIEEVDDDKHRYPAKRVAHASHYLLGPALLSEILLIPLKQAKALLDKYKAVRPSILTWHKEVLQTVRKTMVIETCFGRKIQFFGPMPDRLLPSAVAAGPQSTSASYLNFSIAECYHNNYLHPSWEFLLQVHDSILCQVDDNVEVVRDTIEKMDEISRLHITINNITFTIPMDFEVGYNWYNLVKVKDITKIERYVEEAKNMLGGK